MSDKPLEHHEETAKGSEAVSSPAAKRFAFRLVFLLPLLGLLLAAIIGSHLLGIVQLPLPTGPDASMGLDRIPLVGSLLATKGGESGMTSAIAGKETGELVSSEGVLSKVGRSPVDPSRVLFAAFEKSVLPKGNAGAPSCPVPATPETKTEEAGVAKSGSAKPGRPIPDSRLASVPQVVTKKPPQDAASSEKKDSEPAPPPAAQDRTEPAGKPGSTEPDQPASVSEKPAEGVPTEGARVFEKKERSSSSAKPGATTEADTKSEKYQVPGSLAVNLKNYGGDRVKWALMVILDDSGTMAKTSKIWPPNKMDTAVKAVEKLPLLLTPGSRFAVRDFMCGKADTKEAKTSPCLTHMLSDWMDSPFKGLKENLAKANPSGSNNPCAAAAYSLKKDFGGGRDLSPRIVLITNGAHKCGYGEVLRALEEKGARGEIPVDVVSVGIGKKTRKNYAALAEKTKGEFLALEKPADLEAALSKYGKLLKSKQRKVIEVRGSDKTFKLANGEEITLAPGTYSIVVPEMSGISPSHRTIRDIKVKSGENKRLEISVKKGKPIIRAEKK
ncbi:MAG: hypothetical protein ACOYXY_09945 [Thermodesulfobacteriota bacterium]